MTVEWCLLSQRLEHGRLHDPAQPLESEEVPGEQVVLDVAPILGSEFATMVKSWSWIIGCREAGLPLLQYGAHLASMTSLGTRSPIAPLTARRRRMIFVSLCWARRS